MDGSQLKRWRENRNMTQEQLAGHLGWTRQQLANRESDRTTIPDDIEPRLAELDPTIKPNQNATWAGVYLPYGARWLTMQIQPTTKAEMERQPINSCYWDYCWTDQSTGSAQYSLMQVDVDRAKGRLKGLCTPITLDARLWRAYCGPLYTGHAAVQAQLAKLNSWFDANRVTLSQIIFSQPA